MTEPERPGDAPSGNPTPEEISARLEALLKRTHAMRAEKAAVPASAGVTWPPPERELKSYDVVDVTATDRSSSSGPYVSAAVAAAPASDAEGSPDFSRPGWSELRLRQGAQDAPTAGRWLPVALAVLLAATLGQAAYIWYLQQDRPGTSSATGQLRVNGPAGAQVRIDGAPVGTAPLSHALSPGDYQVQIGADTAAHPVTIEGSSTVVLLPLGTVATRAAAGDAAPPAIAPAPSTPGAGPPTATPASGRPGQAAGPEASAPTAADAGVSATRGTVIVQSTPSGLPVTMEGRERGLTPVTIGQLRPGRHDVLVGGLARKVDVTANQVTTLHVTTP